MDQQQDQPAVSNGNDADESPSVSSTDDGKQRGRGRVRTGGHAIERIAAAARALADTEQTSASGGASKGESAARKRAASAGGKSAGSPGNALVPIGTFGDAAATVSRLRVPTRLPIYAAALCLALAAGGVFGGYIGATGTAGAGDTETAKIERALPWKREMAEVQARDSGKVREDLRALRSEIAALRANNEQLRQADRDRQAQDLRTIKAGLEGQRSETASVKADLAARFDRADHDAGQRADKAAERIDKLERRLADPVVTGSIAKPAAVAAAAPAAEPPKPEKPTLQTAVLRDVAHGIALVETRRGLMEVAPGDIIPGAGRVELIEKHAGKWRVVTSTGVIAAEMD